MKSRAETLSRQAKEQLAAITPSSRREALAEFSAIVQAAGSVNLSGGEMTVSVVTDNEYMPALLARLSLTVMFAPPRVTFAKHITLTFERGKELLVLLGIFTDGAGGFRRVDGIAEGLVRRDSDKRAYARGAFLGSGFLSAGKNNHMEMSFSGEKLRGDVAALFASADIPARQGVRNGKYTVYFKSKEKICDALTFMGASKAALDLQEEMVVSSLEKRATAQQNCDVANIDRAISASAKQIEAINALDRATGLETLDERLRTTALLRLAYPEANMSELAETLGVSKSCVKHRLEKLAALAAHYTDKKE